MKSSCHVNGFFPFLPLPLLRGSASFSFPPLISRSVQYPSVFARFHLESSLCSSTDRPPPPTFVSPFPFPLPLPFRNGLPTFGAFHALPRAWVLQTFFPSFPPEVRKLSFLRALLHPSVARNNSLSFFFYFFLASNESPPLALSNGPTSLSSFFSPLFAV